MSMDKSAADSYVYAKASGMLARSFVGSRATQLFNFRSLQELWSFLFKKEMPVVPETLLAKALEKEAFEKFVSEYKKLLDNYSDPDEVLLSLLQFYDFENLKDMAAAVSLGEKKCPDYQDITPFNIINYSKWPDIQAMTCGGPLSWFNEAPEIVRQHETSYKVDCQYIQHLWNSASKIHGECKSDILKLFGEKFRIDNAVWALRLKIYYKMSKEEIIPLLAYSTGEKKLSDPLVDEAVKILDWELDNYDVWKKWKFASLLNPHEEGVVWNVDPRWISNVYKKVYVEKAYRLFHQHPWTVCPMVCWFIIKRNELDNIRTASESLRLNISSSQAMQIAGVTEVKNG